ncbi:Copper amine oxidase N-terminal domain-containing protein [Fontibacillus panacisegetis]|uniref:Copper amine oxidase N-terminal domain-containing protein n=1 Tax=Fontibacillus panacisegetis TaxID=670482 RepID=A0A1G7G330_9BACL|nr:stalk domain-containing protein [Fontibacillus panacisegetis]SDE82485.1 Copper amine oxidase N-terminal domain-containing protein [Fontibacillus panacisegetis]
MKKIGYLFIGLILGLALSVASPVFAQTVKSITAKINSSVSVVVNGEKVKLNAQPINYNNLNYLPVGEISRALGMNVSYDKASDSINIVDSGSENIDSNPNKQTTTDESIKNEQSQTQQSEIYYLISEVENEISTYFVRFENSKVVIRVGGSSGEELTINRMKSVHDKEGNSYFPESFYLQYLTKEQLNKFQKYTYDSNTSITTPVN